MIAIDSRFPRILEVQMPAPLRISDTRNTAGDVLSRIVKLAPSEVVGLYLLGKGYTPAEFLGYWSVVCLLLVLVFRIWATKSQWPAILVSFIAFAMWVFAMGDPILTITLAGWLASLMILVFTFLVPIFFKSK